MDYLIPVVITVHSTQFSSKRFPVVHNMLISGMTWFCVTTKSTVYQLGVVWAYVRAKEAKALQMLHGGHAWVNHVVGLKMAVKDVTMDLGF